MDNEYNKLRKQMDDADIESILPGFNKETAWQELSPRLKKGRNTYWLRYAAAVVVVLTIALLVKIQMDKAEPTETSISVIKPVPAPAIVPPISLPAALPETTSPEKKPATVKLVLPEGRITPAKQATGSDPIALTQEIVREETAMADNIAKPDTAGTPVVASKVKPVIKRPRAVHLLDIDNENRQAAIQNRNELQTLPQRFVFLIPIGNQHNGNESDRKPSSLFKSN